MEAEIQFFESALFTKERGYNIIRHEAAWAEDITQFLMPDFS